MLIIPFIHRIVNEKNMNVHNIRILTIGGRYLWEESGDINDILNQNGIYCNNIQSDSIYLCEVDTEKTNVNDIYKWSEIDINDTETFCWKDYIYFVGKNNECWLNIPKSEQLGNTNVNTILQLITNIQI